MPLKYKINILAALKDRGYSTYRLSVEKILSHSSIQKLKEGKILSAEGLATLCELLECQPGDILCYEPKEKWCYRNYKKSYYYSYICVYDVYTRITYIFLLYYIIICNIVTYIEKTQYLPHFSAVTKRVTLALQSYETMLQKIGCYKVCNNTL